MPIMKVSEMTPKIVMAMTSRYVSAPTDGFALPCGDGFASAIYGPGGLGGAGGPLHRARDQNDVPESPGCPRWFPWTVHVVVIVFLAGMVGRTKVFFLGGQTSNRWKRAAISHPAAMPAKPAILRRKSSGSKAVPRPSM